MPAICLLSPGNDEKACPADCPTKDACRVANEVVTETAEGTSEDSSIIVYLAIVVVLSVLAIGSFLIFGRRGQDNQ